MLFFCNTANATFMQNRYLLVQQRFGFWPARGPVQQFHRMNNWFLGSSSKLDDATNVSRGDYFTTCFGNICQLSFQQLIGKCRVLFILGAG